MSPNKSLDGIHTQKNTTTSSQKKKFSFFSFVPKTKKRFLSSLLILSLFLGGGFFFFQNTENIKGATYGWIQSNWGGGQTTNVATHTDNQENWTEFASKDANIVTTQDGVSISGTRDSLQRTTDEDWNEGTKNNIYVSNGSIYAQKPPGASCVSHEECSSLTCSNTCLSLCNESISSGQMCGFNGFAYIPIVAKDGKVWLDRNLGATRAATSSNDSQSYGHYYQWGRGSDGHQLSTSTLVSTLSSSDTPGHSSFILGPNTPFDWRSPQNNNLWQGVNGINNPCPSGYRLPTFSEWQSLVSAEGITNGTTAFASTLKLSYAGNRAHSDGSFANQGSYGHYWSSSVSGSLALTLRFYSSSVNPSYSLNRAYGFSVRCLKN